MNLLENEKIVKLQKQLKKHSFLLLLLLFFIVLDFIVGFIFQTRETQTMFIICCSFVLWICLSAILFLSFVFISPEKKYLKILSNAKQRPLTSLEGVVLKELTESYEDGFRVRKFEFKTDENKHPIIVKIEESEACNLEINKKYILEVYSHFVISVREMS